VRSIELFAGAGGLGVGVSMAGFHHELIVERDRWCCDTIRENRSGQILKNWPAPIEGDVREINYSTLKRSIDLVSGGPPCQPFSIGGRHAAYNDSRDMWPEAVRAVRETSPLAFIFENVKGLTRASFATYLSYIHKQLSYPEITRKRDESWLGHLRRLEQHYTGAKSYRGLEYRVLFQVLNAANYGVPQKRERVVFVGFRSDLGLEWAFPKATHSLDSLIWCQTHGDYWDRHRVSKRDRLVPERFRVRSARLEEAPSEDPWLTIRDAIEGLPDPETRRSADGFSNHRFQPGARAYVGHTGSPLDEPAKTLKAGVHGVPGGENMLLRPNGSVRYFTVRESARLQTFPDAFKFHGSWSETMRQLGNAVPVVLAHVVANSVRSQLRAVKRQ
jgi:DNA (cytosine-5)-methyltransferase 1